MTTWHLHIEGRVQGVGFRPFVYRLAQEHHLRGWVNNTTDGVHLRFNADEEEARAFTDLLLRTAPALSHISQHNLQPTDEQHFTDFQIIHSSSDQEPRLLLSPDFAMCPDCRKELHSSGNRREGYAFITCTNCGPRYSITHRLPYDRETTTMDAFEMCPDCLHEYNAPLNRRYYSQTNSCPTCRIRLELWDRDGLAIENEEEALLRRTVEAWQRGEIVAIKGIGGYLLTCDAASAEAIRELRRRKQRPGKPFALLFPDLPSLEAVAQVREVEKKALGYSVSPIVLLEFTEEAAEQLALADIAPGLNRIGVMLPYAPLFELLLQRFGRPVVATSGNISRSPIYFENDKARKELAPIADWTLSHNRRIVVPQDDSVVQYTPAHEQEIILRRSRGLAPSFIQAGLQWSGQCLLATGAMLKSTFALTHRDNTFISPYLGDLEHFDTQESYHHTVDHFLQLFRARPEGIIVDKHPEYPSTHFGRELAQQLEIPVTSVQHHIAHFAAVLGEHELTHSEEPVLGVVWDGTGLGDDGQIWGGEFFKYEDRQFQRCYYFDYFNFILGDKMPREPRISALSACWDEMGAEAVLKDKFTPTEWKIYRQLLDKEDGLRTSSVGRLFDAVASLLGLMDQQTYEGEAAMRLEALATGYFRKHGLQFDSSYFREGAHYYRIPTRSLMSGILLDLQKKKEPAYIAAKFHYSLAKLVGIVATHLQLRRIAFSGGVFQNSLLVDLIREQHSDTYSLYFHRRLSPNDENIAFGQLIYHRIQQERSSIIQPKSTDYVFSDPR